MRNKPVLVGLSGGVDSAVALYLLKKQGYKAIAAAITLSDGDNLCCSMGIVRKLCAQLEVPFYTIDARNLFRESIIEPFIATYRQGRTPNPCVRCNPIVKWGAMLELAARLGIDTIATGHYARTENGQLFAGVDPLKEQSYFLALLSEEQIRRTVLPLGNMRKAETVAIAEDADLPFEKRESQEVCFIPDGDVRGYLKKHIEMKAGDIVFTNGRVIGRHNGACGYTIGQRQGLEVPYSERLYVLRVDAEENRVVVGTRDELATEQFHIERVSWIGAPPRFPAHILVRTRYIQPLTWATISQDGEKLMVKFDEPQDAVAPGQLAAFYDGQRVLGGGEIS